MAVGKKKVRQGGPWIATSDLARCLGHPFYAATTLEANAAMKIMNVATSGQVRLAFGRTDARTELVVPVVDLEPSTLRALILQPGWPP